jgi:hypothetical protein
MAKSKHRKGHKQKVQKHKQKIQEKRLYIQKLTQDLEKAIATANTVTESVQTTLTPLPSTEIIL